MYPLYGFGRARPDSPATKEKTWTEKKRIFRSAGRFRRPRDGFRGDAGSWRGAQRRNGRWGGAELFRACLNAPFLQISTLSRSFGGQIPLRRGRHGFAPANQPFSRKSGQFPLSKRWFRVRGCAPLRLFLTKARPEPPRRTTERLLFGPPRTSPATMRTGDDPNDRQQPQSILR